MSKQLDHKPQTSDSRTEQHPPELLDHSTRDTAIDEQSALARLTRFVLVHRRLVIAGWLVVLIAGAAGASHVSDRLQLDFSLPGQPGYETAKKIVLTLRQRGIIPPAVAVVTVPAGQTSAATRPGWRARSSAPAQPCPMPA